MNPWFAKSAVLFSLLTYVFIRWPHGKRSGTVGVVEDHKGKLEIGLLTLAWIVTTILPIIWLTTSLFVFSEYSLRPVPYGVGIATMFGGLWLFHRSHSDLGTNWSVTLQMRENHRLVTAGVYNRIRHPMYTSMFLLGLAQLLFLPNWIVGPAYLVGFGLLYLFRVKNEEKMMLDSFSEEYAKYMERTGRLIPKFR